MEPHRVRPAALVDLRPGAAVSDDRPQHARKTRTHRSRGLHGSGRLVVAHWRGLETPALAVLLLNISQLRLRVPRGVPSKIMTRLGRQMQRARRARQLPAGGAIGRGGMGEVWRATHRMLARPARHQLIKPEDPTPDRGRRPPRPAALPA